MKVEKMFSFPSDIFTNIEWILPLRTEVLTSFFRFFPFLASDSFYIIVIALGYWLQPHSRLFTQLGFLVPFSTFLNCLLKNLFQLPRPPSSFFLVPVNDCFGFPSGDVQVAAVFWLTISLALPYIILRFLCFLPLFGVMVSRLYLGVHCLRDVAVGLVVGVLIVYLWNTSFVQYAVKSWPGKKGKNFWLFLVLSSVVYAWISQDVPWQPSFLMSLGALIGYGLSLSSFHLNQKEYSPYSLKLRAVGGIINLVGLIGISFFLPVLRFNYPLLYLTTVLKYTLIVWCVYTVLPQAYTLLLKGVFSKYSNYGI